MDVKWLLSDGTIDKINHRDPDINLHLYRNFREVFGEDNLGLLNMSSLKDEIRKNKGSGVYKLDEGLRPYLSSQRGVESKLFLAGGFSVKGENIITRNGLEEVVNYLHYKGREGKIGSLVNSKHSTLFEDKISFVDLYESGFPVIFKRDMGGRGKDVLKLNSREDLEKTFDRVFSDIERESYPGPFILQEFIRNIRDYDCRIAIGEGGKFLFSFKRYLVSTSDSEKPWLASASKGSIKQRYDPSQEEIDLAIKSTKAIGATFNEVDIMFSDEGPVIIENNPTPNDVQSQDNERILKNLYLIADSDQEPKS